MENLAHALEAILFVAGEPVGKARLCQTLEVDGEILQGAIDQLIATYNEAGRGIRLVVIEDSLQLCSAPECAEIIQTTLERRRSATLSPTALEVLSIVAYFGPVTRAYVEKVRGVDSSYTMQTLNARGLIEQCGKLDVPGRPRLYRTTAAFLRSFGLEKLEQLPTLPDADGDHETEQKLREALANLEKLKGNTQENMWEETE